MGNFRRDEEAFGRLLREKSYIIPDEPDKRRLGEPVTLANGMVVLPRVGVRRGSNDKSDGGRRRGGWSRSRGRGVNTNFVHPPGNPI
jgi:hypothetical protein